MKNIKIQIQSKFKYYFTSIQWSLSFTLIWILHARRWMLQNWNLWVPSPNLFLEFFHLLKSLSRAELMLLNKDKTLKMVQSANCVSLFYYSEVLVWIISGLKNGRIKWANRSIIMGPQTLLRILKWPYTFLAAARNSNIEQH